MDDVLTKYGLALIILHGSRVGGMVHAQSDYEKLMYLAFQKYSDYQPYLKKEADFVKERISAYAQN